jgi:hypothetical protein
METAGKTQTDGAWLSQTLNVIAEPVGLLTVTLIKYASWPPPTTVVLDVGTATGLKVQCPLFKETGKRTGVWQRAVSAGIMASAKRESIRFIEINLKNDFEEFACGGRQPAPLGQRFRWFPGR